MLFGDDTRRKRDLGGQSKKEHCLLVNVLLLLPSLAQHKKTPPPGAAGVHPLNVLRRLFPSIDLSLSLSELLSSSLATLLSRSTTYSKDIHCLLCWKVKDIS